MGNRFQIKQYNTVRKFLIARDGEHCLICGKKPPLIKLQIDHADNNPCNWDPDNLHLLCQQDNLKLRYVSIARHKRIIERCAGKNTSDRVCERGPEPTAMIKEIVDYRAGSPEMKANSYFETQFVEWLLAEIKKNGSLVKKEIINCGATVVGCSQLTVSRYLDKLTCNVGPLEEIKDPMGAVSVRFREGFKKIRYSANNERERAREREKGWE